MFATTKVKDMYICDINCDICDIKDLNSESRKTSSDDQTKVKFKSMLHIKTS